MTTQTTVLLTAEWLDVLSVVFIEHSDELSIPKFQRSKGVISDQSRAQWIVLSVYADESTQLHLIMLYCLSKTHQQ